MIAQIIYFDSGEIVPYNDREKFIVDIKETIYIYGLSGWECKLYCDDLKKEISKMIEDEFG